MPSKVYAGTLKSDSGPFSQSLSNMAESKFTSIETLAESQIELYPNPANTSFSVTIVEPAVVHVFSLEGQLLISKNIVGNESISLNAIPAGIYIVKIQTNNTIVTRSLIVR